MARLRIVIATAWLGLLAALCGVFVPVAALVALLGAAVAGMVILSAPVLGTYGLVLLSHIDAFALYVDRVLPMSSFKLLSAAMLATLIVTARHNPALMGRPRPSSPMLFCLLFAAWIAFSHLMSADMDPGRDHTIGFLSTLLMVAFVGLTVSKPEQLRMLAAIFAASGAISAALVILETTAGLRLVPRANPLDIAAWQGAVRSAGASAYNPTTAAHLLLASLTVALVMTLNDRRWRPFWGACALVCLVALPMTGARSAILAFGATVVMIGWSLRRHRLFPLALAGAVVAGLVALPFVPAALWERFSVVSDFLDGGNTADRTLLRRLSYNLIGLELWSRHPIVGIGPGSYPAAYAADEFRWFPGRLPVPRQLHNSYLEVLAELGIVGLALFLGATLGAVRVAFRAAARGTGDAAVVAGAFGTALAAFLVASLFMPNEDNKYLWIMVAVCARAAWIARAPGLPEGVR